MSQTVKLGYKQTEVGVIPEEWEVKRLHEVTDLQVGFAFKSDWFGKHNGTRLLRGENVGYGAADWSDTRTLEGKQEDGFRSYLLNPGDVVIGMDRTFTKTGSKITLIRKGDCPCLLVQRVGRFVSKKCDKSFLWFVLASETVQSRLRLEQKGMDIPHLSRSEILHPFAIFPPLPEQRAIAAALSDLDALLAALDRLIAKQRDLKQAAMQQLLTGQTRLPGFTGKWETKRLGDVANIKTGSRNNEDKVEDGLYPFFVRSEVVERINSYSHDCEAILVPGEGRIGNIFHYIQGRFDVHQRVYAITQFKAEISGRFIHYHLSKNFGVWAMQNTVKATVDSLRLPTFQTFEMLLPPTLPEQTAIATVLSDMDLELAALEQRRNKTRALKQGMMQELLTGRTRLCPGNAEPQLGASMKSQ